MSKESFSSIKNEFLREQARASDLAEQLREKDEQIKINEQRQKHTEKLIRDLCTEILAKDRDEMVLGKPYSWRSVQVDDLIEKAVKSYKARNIARSKIMNETLDLAEARRQEIESLKDQITMIMQGGSIKDPEVVKEAIEATTDIKANFFAKQAHDQGKIELIQETDEDIDLVTKDEREAITEAATIAQKKSLIDNAIPIIETPRRKEMIEEIKKEVVMSHVVDLQEWIVQMTEPMWHVVEVIGKYGFPLYKDIEKKVFEEHTDMKTSRLRSAMQLLSKMNVIQQNTVKTPLSKSKLVYNLDDIGKRLFIMKFGSNPVESEVEKIIAEHDNLEHGYGIIEISDVLKENGFYVEVSTFNRRNAIKIDGKYSYIPDIICKREGAKYTEYFEYERGHHLQTDFNDKCNKMAKVTRFLNFVVPNKEALEKIVGQVNKWAEKRGQKSIENLKLRITTSAAIRDSKNKTIDWIVEYNFKNGMTPVRKDVVPE